MEDIIQIQKSEYDAILRQAVAVIDKTRAMVATTVVQFYILVAGGLQKELIETNEVPHCGHDFLLFLYAAFLQFLLRLTKHEVHLFLFSRSN